MARSMTGYARSESSGPWGKLTWEARSVNHRYLDVRLRLPEMLRSMEPAFREAAAKQLARGKVELDLRLEPAEQAQALTVDEARLQALLAALEQVHRAAPAAPPPDRLQILQCPGILQETPPDTEALQNAALEALRALLADLQDMRQREGERLAAMLRDRATQIAERATAAAARLPAVQQAWEQRLRERLAELDVVADPARLEQELVFTAQRMDVAEELERLQSHVTALAEALSRDEPLGRRLDFLMQEFNREANTLASKSQDSELTAHAVEMKVLIEQMREQVQNLE